jgi:HEPN domain-containing protein
MIPVTDLRKLARARLRDAEVLLKAKRHDGGLYLCGYAIELALKAKICRTLHWTGFPETDAEFRAFRSLKTHSLEILLRFSGAEAKIKSCFFAEWSAVANWDPEARYSLNRTKTATAKRADLKTMINSTKKLLAAL